VVGASTLFHLKRSKNCSIYSIKAGEAKQLQQRIEKNLKNSKKPKKIKKPKEVTLLAETYRTMPKSPTKSCKTVP
jgi:hypothetical protein